MVIIVEYNEIGDFIIIHEEFSMLDSTHIYFDLQVAVGALFEKCTVDYIPNREISPISDLFRHILHLNNNVLRSMSLLQPQLN